MEILEYSEGIILKDVKDFELKHIFDCGQCFRWNDDRDGSYTGVASGRAVRFIKDGSDVYIKGGKIHDKDFWIHYLDLNRDYGKIKDELSKDETLKEAIKHGEGIRILNQEPFETLISFIISANNRIPMIKRAVENISRNFGEKIIFEGREYYSFPDPERLSYATVEKLEECGCGFRAPYIVETTREILEGRADLEHIKSLDTDNAHRELIKLKGIGPKVADCILLFSMGKHDAFPVDVWVKRVMQHFYLAPDVSLKKIRDFGREKFGKNAGFAQQYLFYYARDLKGKEGLKN
ncbi:DNA-3-methyladenine glycosylase family protein [Fonticella tunisiensis]|uniref:DNA-(apurinic or apyrimidinic site) lyase n=1 Tax=Fonticella tunisiensis TaxID=1096341 RepID=A0A4R7KB28_9CLOT|nr:DNA-3-methyladenine glycosylase [Fonticella tunisiensis]TDT50290.1 N-glycosylase/DNA lyase [Fonticella tunisiensis]